MHYKVGKQVASIRKDKHRHLWQVPYDKLVIATGTEGSAYNTPGVMEHAYCLRDVEQARVYPE